MSDTKESISTNDLLKTNQRLNEQIKSLIMKNDELTQTVIELEKELSKKEKFQEKENTFKVKGVTVLFIEVQGHKDIIEDESCSESLYDKLDEIYIKFNEIAKKHHGTY